MPVDRYPRGSMLGLTSSCLMTTPALFSCVASRVLRHRDSKKGSTWSHRANHHRDHAFHVLPSHSPVCFGTITLCALGQESPRGRIRSVRRIGASIELSLPISLIGKRYEPIFFSHDPMRNLAQTLLRASRNLRHAGAPLIMRKTGSARGWVPPNCHHPSRAQRDPTSQREAGQQGDRLKPTILRKEKAK